MMAFCPQALQLVSREQGRSSHSMAVNPSRLNIDFIPLSSPPFVSQSCQFFQEDSSSILSSSMVLVSLGWYNKFLKMREVSNNRILFIMVLEAGSLR